jgi:hypothetical protein
MFLRSSSKRTIQYKLDETINNDPDENQLKHFVYDKFGFDFPTNEIEIVRFKDKIRDNSSKGCFKFNFITETKEGQEVLIEQKSGRFIIPMTQWIDKICNLHFGLNQKKHRKLEKLIKKQ